MWQDPIVAEARSLREQYAAQFGHDAEAIFADIARRQEASGTQRLSFRSRQPTATSVSLAPSKADGEVAQIIA